MASHRNEVINFLYEVNFMGAQLLQISLQYTTIPEISSEKT
jgi:hypothetical protein